MVYSLCGLAALILCVIALSVVVLLVGGLVLLERVAGLHSLYFTGDLELLVLFCLLLPMLTASCRWLVVRCSNPRRGFLSVHFAQTWLLYLVSCLAIASLSRNPENARGLQYGLMGVLAAVTVITIVIHAIVAFRARKRIQGLF